jgi:hypothetical protein
MHHDAPPAHAAFYSLGEFLMRKSALLLAVLMVAAAPATALAAKKKAAAPADPNANAKKFVASAAQQPVHIWRGMWSPWWVAQKK